MCFTLLSFDYDLISSPSTISKSISRLSVISICNWQLIATGHRLSHCFVCMCVCVGVETIRSFSISILSCCCCCWFFAKKYIFNYFLSTIILAIQHQSAVYVNSLKYPCSSSVIWRGSFGGVNWGFSDVNSSSKLDTSSICRYAKEMNWFFIRIILSQIENISSIFQNLQ